jgi:hypothetical protein
MDDTIVALDPPVLGATGSLPASAELQRGIAIARVLVGWPSQAVSGKANTGRPRKAILRLSFANYYGTTSVTSTTLFHPRP